MNSAIAGATGGDERAPRRARSTARRDLIITAILTVLAAALCARFNLTEAIKRWTAPLEGYQVDELPQILLVLAICLMWFSMRRHREARREIDRRRRAEQHLAAVLAENRRLAQQYLETQEAERRALARDLHDELGQYLNAVKIDAVALRERCASLDPVGHRTATEAIRNIDHVQGVLLGLIRQLRPVGLDELGLAAALEHCVNEWRRRLPQLSIELSIGEPLHDLDEPRRLAVYRLVQEALTNVARHSRATRVRIRIAREQSGPPSADRLAVCVEDDGVGIDAARPHTGLGLIGMRERVEAAGGSFAMDRSAAGGLALRARIPLEAWRR